MKKNVQRINESQLRAIVAESVKKVLKEDHTNKTPSKSDINFQKAFRVLQQALAWIEKVDFYDVCKGCGYSNGKAREIELKSRDIVNHLRYDVLEGDWAMIYNTNNVMFTSPNIENTDEKGTYIDELEKHTGGSYSPHKTYFVYGDKEHSKQSDEEMYTDDYIEATNNYIKHRQR